MCSLIIKTDIKNNASPKGVLFLSHLIVFIIIPSLKGFARDVFQCNEEPAERVKAL
jgi:hypothetical protein